MTQAAPSPPRSSWRSREQPPRWAIMLLWIMILAYTAYFSALSIRLHTAQQTHTADLGQVDLAIWNTSRGRFVQEIKGDQLSSRLTDHVEPIFLPVSLVFWLWNDVRALLVLQSLLLGLGAWPVFYFAYGRLGGGGGEREKGREGKRGRRVDQVEGRQVADSQTRLPANSHTRTPAHPHTHTPTRFDLPSMAGLSFALVYLLYPALQAANLAEFHALPLATPLILVAFLFIQRRQWGRFAVAALLVAAVQEGTALLAALLGAYALVVGLRRHRAAIPNTQSLIPNTQYPIPNTQYPTSKPLLAGAFVLFLSLAWFYIATFVIVPAHAAQAYGLDESPYVARFGALGDSFAAVVRTLLTRPLQVLQVAMEPLRVQYAVKLLAPVGFLAILAPGVLLLGLPLLLANLLSAFPFQYSGLLHYSAPLVAYAVIAAIIGCQYLGRSLQRLAESLGARRMLRACRHGWPALAWVLGWTLASQIASGYTPIGSQFRFNWPAVTDHHRLLARFTQQIPAGAPLSTMPTLYPHLSHRQFIYQFPILADSRGEPDRRARYVLVDAAARSGWSTHPVTVRDRVEELLRSGQWAVVDAADGYLLLRADDQAPALSIANLPAAFFSFALPAPGTDAQPAAPQIPLDITFGDRLKLVGYDVIDDPQWRQTAFRFYWQALEPLPEDLKLRVFILTADGEEVDSTDLRPLMQPLWYPPARWPVGEVVVTDKLPWFLPDRWAAAVGVYRGDDWDAAGARWPVAVAAPSLGLGDSSAAEPDLQTLEQPPVTFEDATWVLLDTWQRRTPPSLLPAHSRLVTPAPPTALQPMTEVFAGDGWTVNLTGVSRPTRAAPGQDVSLVLRWQAENEAPRDYTIFVHLLNPSGKRKAIADATPHYYGPLPTSRWQPGQTVLDAHTLPLPAGLAPGVYDVFVGWYYWETQERLALLGPDGLPSSDGAVIAQLEVDPTAGPGPDLCCALAPACCASRSR